MILTCLSGIKDGASLFILRVPSTLSTSSWIYSKQNQKDILADVKCLAQCLVCTTWPMNNDVVMARWSGKRKGCYEILVKNFSRPVQYDLKHRRIISKGRRGMEKNKGFHQLSARGIPQRSREALTRAARMADIIRSQPHKTFVTEQRTEWVGKVGCRFWKGPKWLCSGTNPQLARVPMDIPHR